MPYPRPRRSVTGSAPHPLWPRGTVFILDLEEGSGDQAPRAMAWHNTVDTFYGLNDNPLNERSWLYSYTSFVTSHNLAVIFASNRHTWIAAYQNSPPAIGHTLWQSTDGQNGSNITNWPGCGRCDTSQHNGNLDTLSADAWPQRTLRQRISMANTSPLACSTSLTCAPRSCASRRTRCCG